MPGVGAKAGFVRSVVDWLAGRLTSRARASAARHPASRQPREACREVKQAGQVPNSKVVAGARALGLGEQLALSRSRALSARLRSVASENVATSLAPRKAATNSPAGKAIPKVMPRVVKRYRRAGQAPVISARLRILKLTSLRPSNVIDLVVSLKALRAAWTAPKAKAA